MAEPSGTDGFQRSTSLTMAFTYGRESLSELLGSRLPLRRESISFWPFAWTSGYKAIARIKDVIDDGVYCPENKSSESIAVFYFLLTVSAPPFENGEIINVERIYQSDTHYSGYENLPE